MTTPSTSWQRLLSGNQAFAQTLRAQPAKPVSNNAPLAVVFRCADDTMASKRLLSQAPGSLVDVSTWGHVIDTGVLASIEHAVGTLHTPLIIMLGHHRCEAMHTALQSWNNIAIPNGATRAVIEQAMSSLIQSGANTHTADQLADTHMAHTAASLLAKSPLIANAVDTQQCAIICLTADPVTGHLHICGTLGKLNANQTPLLQVI